MKNLKENNFLIPQYLLPHFRSNHAGETGAVYIYKGILAVSSDSEIRQFSRKHLTTESQHLKLIEEVLEKKNVSKLITVWKLAGFLTGLIPALLGKRFVYATIYHVESFVEKHYQEQIDILSKKNSQIKLKKMITELMNDEISHKEESLINVSKLSFVHKIWGTIVTAGSKLAVGISKKI